LEELGELWSENPRQESCAVLYSSKTSVIAPGIQAPARIEARIQASGRIKAPACFVCFCNSTFFPGAMQQKLKVGLGEGTEEEEEEEEEEDSESCAPVV
jgi:hypothetical protein